MSSPIRPDLDDDLRRRVAELKRQGMSREQVRETLMREQSVPRETRSPMDTMPQRAESTSAAATPQGGVSRASRAGMLPAGIARSALTGVTLGAGDEIEGFVRGVLPGGRSIRERTDAAREGRDEFREAFPKTAFLTEAGAGFLPIAAPLKAANVFGKGAKSISLGTQLRRGAGTGAAVGGAAGFLSTDGGAGGRTAGALFGAPVGATLGVAVPAVAAAGRRLAPGFLNTLSRRMPSVSNTRGAAGTGQVDEVERLGRQYFGAWGKPEQRAVQLAVTRAERDGIDFVDALQKVAPMTEGGRPMIYADIGEESTRSLFGAAELIPSATTTRAERLRNTRSTNRGPRMGRDYMESTGTERVPLGNVVDPRSGKTMPRRAQQILEEEQPSIDRLYGEVQDARTQVPLSVPSSRALTTPETQRAYTRAMGTAEEAAPIRGRRPLEPLTETVEEVSEVPMAAPGQIVRTPRQDGRVIYEGGNPKYAKMSTERLEALYKENLERIQRGSDMEARGAKPWTRYDDDIGETRNGFAVTNEYGRGKGLGNVASRQAQELEAEIVGRYQGMPIEELGSRPNVFEGSPPIWSEFAEEGVEPSMREVVTGTRQQPRDAVSLETLDATKKELDARILELESKPGSASADRLASLKANRASIVEDMRKANPQFRDATGLFEETQRRAEAVTTGRRLGKSWADEDEIGEALQDMSPLELEEARNAMATVRARGLRDGTNVGAALDPRKSEGLDARTRAAFGGDAAKELERRTELERRMLRTERAGGGSNTANKLANQADIGDEAVSPDRVSAFARHPIRESLNIGLRGAAKGYNKYLLGVRGETAGRIGDLMLGGEKGAPQLQEVLRLLAAGRDKEASRLASRLRAAGALSNVAGQQAGR